MFINKFKPTLFDEFLKQKFSSDTKSFLYFLILRSSTIDSFKKSHKYDFSDFHYEAISFHACPACPWSTRKYLSYGKTREWLKIRESLSACLNVSAFCLRMSWCYGVTYGVTWWSTAVWRFIEWQKNLWCGILRYSCVDSVWHVTISDILSWGNLFLFWDPIRCLARGSSEMWLETLEAAPYSSI